MDRRSFLAKISAAASLVFVPGLGHVILPKAEASSGRTLRLAFGSCLDQYAPQPIWSAIRGAAPDAFIFLGDNVYADTTDMEKMRSDYALLDADPGFAALRKSIPVLGTWDDHDYGQNDSGAEYPKKAESQQLMLDFFREPASSPRRSREGVYESYFFGEGAERVQLLLLDLRYHRSSPGDPRGTMLGDAQWAWLEQQLQQPASLRILGSSVQLVSSEHQWEKWSNFPSEKERLYRLLDRENVNNLLVISGDMHFSELSMERTPGGIEIFDFTCSGLNVVEEVPGITNSRRLFCKDNFAHFGLIQVRLNGGRIEVGIETRGLDCRAVFQKEIRFAQDR